MLRSAPGRSAGLCPRGHRPLLAAAAWLATSLWTAGAITTDTTLLKGSEFPPVGFAAHRARRLRRHRPTGSNSLAASRARAADLAGAQPAALAHLGRNSSNDSADAAGSTDSGGEAASEDDTADGQKPGNVLSKALKILVPNATTTNTSQADVVQVTLNGDSDLTTLISTLVTSIIATLFLSILFVILRRWNYAVYSQLKDDEESGDAPASILSGFQFSLPFWVSEVLATTPEDEVQQAGLDGWSLLEFYRFNRRVMLALAGPVLLVLLPVHYFSSAGSGEDLLGRLDIGAVKGSWVFWMHGFFTWFVVITVSWFLHRAHQDFLARRFAWLGSIPSPQATTVMIQNIPKEFRTDKALEDYFAGPMGVFDQKSQIVETAYVVRQTRKLQPSWEKLQETMAQLSLITHRREGSRAASEETVEALKKSMQQQSETVAVERSRIEQGVVEGDPKICTGSGFVTFNSVLWQRLALKETFRADKNQFHMSMPPDPNDVVWENLFENFYRNRWSEVFGWLCLVLIFLFWSPIVVFISTLTTLSTIQKFVPAASHILDALASVNPAIPSLVEGLLATAAMKFFLCFLPAILFSVIRTFFPVTAGVLAQFRLYRWYFSFQVLFVLLVTLLGRSVVVTATTLVNNPTSVIELLATWLPSASHFYFNYLIFGWITLVWETIRIANLLKYWFYRRLYSSSVSEAKIQSEPEDPASFGLGTRMGLAGLMSAITLVFCTVSPLIIIFGWVYFAIGRLTYGYLLLFTETKKPDLGGQFWVESVNQVFFILALYALLMTGVLSLHMGSYFSGPTILAFTSFVPMYLMYSRITSYEWETLPLEKMMAAWHQGDHRPTRREGVYRQPECIDDANA